MKKSRRRKPNYIFLFLAVLLCVVIAGSVLLSVMYVLEGEKRIGEQKASEAEIPITDILFGQASEEAESTAEPVTGKYGDILNNPEYMAEHRIYQAEGKNAGEVTLTFAGDVMFDDSYTIMNEYRKAGGNIAGIMSPELLQEMRDSDIFMLNHESTFTTRGEPTPEKTYTFRGDPQNVKLLMEMGVDIVSQANNHSYDYGEISLLDTLDTLKGVGIPYVGAGRDSEEAGSPVFYIVNDIKIAFVAATQIERLKNPDTKEATADSPGVFRCMDPKALLETIQKAKAESDFVVLFVHWGTENTTDIDWMQRDQAPMYAEAGADLIIGSHPHCLQGITYAADTPVVYSLGNFWFNSKTVDTGILKAVITMEGLKSLQFVPGLQANCRTSLLTGSEKERVLLDMRNISPGVQIDEKGFVSLQ